MSETNHQVERCDQCGSPREEWQPAEENRCPRHAMPEPYSSCDGTLRPPPRDLSRVAVRTCPISGLESHR